MPSTMKSGARASIQADLSATETADAGRLLIDAASAFQANIELLADPAMGSPASRAEVVAEAQRAVTRLVEIARGLRAAAQAHSA